MRVTKNKWRCEIRFQNICRCAAEDFGFGSFQRHKVTFGISVVTHSSAGKRLGYMLLWKCTSCMIILYSRLNGVHPILYLVNMSHLICVCVCVSAVYHPCEPRVRTRVTQRMWTQYCMSMSALKPHECRICEWVCESISIITPHTPQASVWEEPWSQGTPQVSVWCIRRQKISHDRERHRGNKSIKH